MAEIFDYSIERHPVTPKWIISPQEHEHAPVGHPPFDILYIPEHPGLIDARHVFMNMEGRERLTDNQVLESSIHDAIEKQKTEIQRFNQVLELALKAEGVSEEEIERRKKKFFDGKLARLHPHDFGVTANTSLYLSFGETTYFTYAGSRRKEDLQTYGYDRLGLPLAVCSIITAPSEDGSTKVLYTVRGTANESYPGWFHAVGGTVQTAHNGIPNPTGALRREIHEELGLTEDEFTINGISGIVMNNFDIHPELIHQATVTIPLEQWHNNRTTDKEVDAEFFTDTPQNLEAFILGQPFEEVSDPRPIVPSGLSGYLFYGRIKYGQNWYNNVMSHLPQY